MKQAPYGTWHSPLAAADLAGSAISLNYVRGLGRRPLLGGKPPCRRRAQRRRDFRREWHAVQELTPPGFNVRTRVHEYGGTPYVMSRDTVYFSNFTDQRLYVQRLDEKPVALTPAGYRYSDFELDTGWPTAFLCQGRSHRRR